MRKTLLIVTSLLFITSTTFSQSKVNVNSLKEYGGKMFLPNDDKPFTGKVFDLDENTGEKKIEGLFRKGVKNGKWTWWDEEGLKDSSGYYNNGLKNGLWLYWDEKENKSKKGTFRNGLLVGIWYYYQNSISSAIIETKTDSISYSIGIDLGRSLLMKEVDISDQALMAGWRDGYNESDPKLDDETRLAILNSFRKELSERTRVQEKEAAEKNLTDGKAFLAENAKKEGVVTTESGLQYKVLEMGTGAKPSETDKVTVHYRGTLINGEEFDSSYNRGEAISLSLTSVIKGWTEALQLMPVGSKWELFIPSNLAYGDGPRGPGGPNSTLLFEVELLGIE